VEILTGRARYTEYGYLQQFSEDLAPALVRESYGEGSDDLWGYINKDLELVIPAWFRSAQGFINGKAVAETPDGTYYIINKRGESLMSVPKGNYIEQHFDGHGYTVHSLGEREETTHYTSDLVEVILPTETRSSGELMYTYYRGDGWFCGILNHGGMFLFNMSGEYYFPLSGNVFHMDGKYAVYQEYHDHHDSGVRWGAISLSDWTKIIEEQDAWISVAAEDGMAKAFMVNSTTPYFGQFAAMRGFASTPSVYRLYDTDGNLIASGPGVLAYDEAAGLYSVLGADHYAWLDADGKTIIRIPLMSYTLD